MKSVSIMVPTECEGFIKHGLQVWAAGQAEKICGKQMFAQISKYYVFIMMGTTPDSRA